MKQNKIYFDNNWGFSIGQFEDNLPHKHYAIQINISLDSEVILTTENNQISRFKNFLIKSNVSHQLTCKTKHLLLLFYPTSPIGYYLNQLSDNDITEFKHPILKQLKEHGISFLNGKIDFKKVVLEISHLLDTITCQIEMAPHYKDDRIRNAIKHLETNFNRVVSLKEIAEIQCLSESRFLHLFKEKTGVTFRKFQQWNKVSKSFSVLRDQSLTKTAHQFGFTDSSHYTKVFKETFGFNPKYIQKS